jgi:hypothetical protein
MQQLCLFGTPCKLFRGAEAHAANEAGDNLVPWNGDPTNMIDRCVWTSWVGVPAVNAPSLLPRARPLSTLAALLPPLWCARPQV